MVIDSDRLFGQVATVHTSEAFLKSGIRGGRGMYFPPLSGGKYGIKVIPLERAGLARDDAIREAELGHFLCHPHLVHTDTYDVSDGKATLVMQHGGCSLDDLLRLPFSPPEKIVALHQIAQGVAFMHDHGIAHLDLKPANVVGKNGHYKITDFGTAVLFEPSKAVGMNMQLQRKLAHLPGVSTGSDPVWRAPEQEEGFGECASDIYSFGEVTRYVLGNRVTTQLRACYNTMYDALCRNLAGEIQFAAGKAVGEFFTLLEQARSIKAERRPKAERFVTILGTLVDAEQGNYTALQETQFHTSAEYDPLLRQYYN